LRKANISFVMCVCPSIPSAWNNSSPTGCIFIKLCIFESVVEVQISLIYEIITDTLRENLYTFMETHSLILLRMRNVSEKRCRENKSSHFMFSILLFFSENRAVCEIIWEKYCRTRQATDDSIIGRMRFACWIPKAKTDI
jgi:hypothetical protein